MMVATRQVSELISVLNVYNDVAEKLKKSHEALAGEVHRLRKELDEKSLELQRSARLSALGEMAAGVAHEIRNPLGGIGLYASLLQQDLTDRPAQQDLARRIGAGVQNLENIVRDILAFAGAGPNRQEPFDLGEAVQAVVLNLAPQVQEYESRVHIDDGLEGLKLFGDGGRVERALLNLVVNAIEAAGRGGRVWIRGGGAERALFRLLVEDNGPGLEPGALHRIFQPFYTTKDYGTGLGLAIVHSIAESHGGFVCAGNRRGGGASFVLALPTACRLAADLSGNLGQG